MRAQSVLCMLLGLALAGCVSAESKDQPGDDPMRPDAELDPNGEFGLVRGTIVDEEASPIPGAQVGLADSDHLTATNQEGKFALGDLPPGEHVLIAAALGYEAAARTITITAGQATDVSLVLSRIEVLNETIQEVVHFSGFFECALGTNVWISACSWPYTAAWGTAKNNGVNLSNYGAPMDIQKNTHRFNFTVRPGVGQLVSELTWQSSSAAATRMLLMTLCGDYDYVNDECVGRIRYGPGNGVAGTNPIKSVIEGDEFVDKGKGKGKYDLTKNDKVWVMSYVGLPFGNPQVAFQQKFEVWDTIFYNGVGPEDYTILPDQ